MSLNADSLSWSSRKALQNQRALVLPNLGNDAIFVRSQADTSVQSRHAVNAPRKSRAVRLESVPTTSSSCESESMPKDLLADDREGLAFPIAEFSLVDLYTVRCL